MRPGFRVHRASLRYAFAIAVIALAVIIGVNHHSKKIDPVVNGKRLSAAVANLLYIQSNTVEYAESAEVIRAVGTNAFPLLIRELTVQETTFERWKRIHKVRYLPSIPIFGRRIAACRAIRVLGAEAKPLEEHVRGVQVEFGKRAVAPVTEALAAINPTEALALMTNSLALSAPHSFHLHAARFSLRAGGDPSIIITLLLTNCLAPIPRHQLTQLAQDIKEMPIDHAAIENALLRHNSHPSIEARLMVAIMLPVCFPESPSTLAALRQLARDTNQLVAFAATNSIRILGRQNK